MSEIIGSNLLDINGDGVNDLGSGSPALFLGIPWCLHYNGKYHDIDDAFPHFNNEMS